MAVIALWSPSDLLTSVLTPVALARTRSTSLVIDLDPVGPRYGGEFTLADLVRDGPTRSQLEPQKRPVAVLANGGVGAQDAAEVVGALVDRWPNVVLRCDPSEPAPIRAVPIVPLLPAPFAPSVDRPAVYQSLGLSVRPPEGALVLPRPTSAVVESVLGLRMGLGRSRWLASVSKLWGLGS
jgi:hypothetical protein